MTQQETMTDQQLYHDLADRARQQTIGSYGPQAADLFHAAEQLVLAGHVQRSLPNWGHVYAGGEWRTVSTGYCGHCRITDPRVICVHKLAIAYADLLHRHTALNTPAAAGHPSPSASLPVGRRPSACASALSGPTWRSRRTNRPDHKHCPRCGGWLTREGGCNKCGGAR